MHISSCCSPHGVSVSTPIRHRAVPRSRNGNRRRPATGSFVCWSKKNANKPAAELSTLAACRRSNSRLQSLSWWLHLTVNYSTTTLQRRFELLPVCAGFYAPLTLQMPCCKLMPRENCLQWNTVSTTYVSVTHHIRKRITALMAH